MYEDKEVEVIMGKKYLYNNYIQKLNDKFLMGLDSIEADYNFDYGDEFEIAICEILRLFLPIKYGICRGCVVSSNGDKVGDDIIIYDQNRFPTLRLRIKNDFSRKENIPCEAVYGYIEAKHGFNKEVFLTALSQIENIKRLCNKRKKVGLYQNDPHIESHNSIKIESLPEYRNPLFSMIIFRNTKYSKESTRDILQDGINTFFTNKCADENQVDVVIAGQNNGLFVGYKKNDVSIPTIFALSPEKNKMIGYQNLIKPKLMFGIALSQLIHALDFIRLGIMPWIDMLNEAKTE